MLIEPKAVPAGADATPTVEPATARRRRLRSASEVTAPARRPHRDAAEWAAFAQLLVERREQLGVSRRQAARRAGISERAWKTLETGLGSSLGSVRLLPNPTDDELARIADALELAPEVLFGELGTGAPRSGPADPLTDRIATLSAGDRRLVEALVARLLAGRR